MRGNLSGCGLSEICSLLLVAMKGKSRKCLWYLLAAVLFGETAECSRGVCQLPLTEALQRAGGLDLNYNRASILCLAPEPPHGSFDVCAFSQLGELLANCVVGGREAQRLPSAELAGNRVMSSAPAGPKVT